MRTLKEFTNQHPNKTIVVCGCGASLNDLERPERFITVGVNDVGRRFQPNYLVVVNPQNQFSGDRFGYVETSKAEYLFTQLDLDLKRENVVKFQLGTFGGTDFSDGNVLHYTNNSPYIAVCLAILMGAKRIGVIGVDFTEHHFYAKTGRHPLAAQFETINGQYERLAQAAASNGIEIFNLSQISRLTAFPKMPLGEFENLPTAVPEKTESLKIVSYATTPVAGVPAILARCINDRTTHSARCVWATNDYGNGVKFAGDVEWRNQPQLAESFLTEADLIIVHNGKVAAEHEKLFRDRAILTMAHNYLWNVDERFFKSGFPGVVVGQYQATLEEFKNWAIVPNPIPFWETDYQPEIKPDQITICYTPSGKHEKHPCEHRLYWHSKGYATTMRILEKLAKQFPIKLEVIGDRQISHAESLAMKRRSHIVIDECVTGSYHRNSLEGLAGGAVVVNGLGILPKVSDVLRYCAGERAENPFVSATLENLEEVLTRLIESGRENLVRKGAENRAWIEKHWNFSRQWQKFWIPAIEKSFAKVKRKVSFACSENKESNDILLKEVEVNQQMKEFKKGVSVVIPHGGQNRLPHLQACLANLRQCREVGEIIVAEMDQQAHAAKIARKWADKYCFIHQTDLFERARTLNTGSAFAECEFVLWLDNDLLLPTDFIPQAVAEMNAKSLDFLLPFSEIKYLSFSDSEKVMHGTLNPNECRPIKIYTNTMTDGGTGLVRTAFLRRFGGIPQKFRGWGGEDNGWMGKVNLLGKSERSKSNQTVFHIYHNLSGANGGDVHILANPQYQNNFETLEKIRRISSSDEFLKEFPPDKIRLCGDSAKIYFVVEKSAANFSAISDLKKDLSEQFGIETQIVSARTAKSELAKQNSADAVIFFDNQKARKTLCAKYFAPMIEKTIVVADSIDAISNFPQVFGVLTANDEDFIKLETIVSKDSMWKFDAENLAAGLAQTLSILVNNSPIEIETEQQQAAKKSATPKLPVWFYWEGKRPQWIELCHQTIVANSPETRFLTPEIFAEMWTEDCDIDLSHLYVAHRADFIRAYLLAKFGGLWIDADCIVTQDLSGLIEKLGEVDFIAHRERSGYFANCFMGAKKDSVIAAELYARICRFLRENRRISWLEIGSKPLTEILHTTDAPFLEIECERIQPICWSQPEKFFALGNRAEHERNFNENAICYMLSNGAVINYQNKNPNADLTAENSFFSYAVRRALKEITAETKTLQPENDRLRQNGNRLKSLSFYLEMIDRIAPQKVLDADVGSGRWAMLLRDFFESSNGANEAQMKIEAVVETKPKNTEILNSFYDRVQTGKLENSLKTIEDKQNLLIFGDYLTRNGNFQNPQILEQSLNLSDYVLLNFYEPKNGLRQTDSERNLKNYLGANPAKIAAVRKTEGAVCVLLSHNDPKNIRPNGNSADVFCRIAEHYARQNEESIAGPGCSLKSTIEIRRALPLLFSSLGINSMLDARCGDFNWLRFVDLRLEKYYGADIVPSLVERNRELYENERRKFIVADITKDFLPETDLILCRDFLVHLSFADIFSALRNFSSSGSKYLLTTTFPDKQSNSDIETGDWRTLNFGLPPFNFPAPVKLLNEKCAEGGGEFADKSLGLWLISDIYKILN